MTSILSLRTLVAAPSILAALLVGGLAGGCVAGAEPDSDNPGTLDSAISASDAIARAMEWVDADLQYCQSANHARDYDTSCSAYCERTDDAAWDPYRSDCSGLVSWAWGLPAPGRVTGEFAPFETDITHSIAASSLQPGDAVNNSDHVMLFKAWVTPGKEATFIEEPGCSANPPHAHEFTSTVSINGDSIYVPYNGMTFTAIRYDALGGGSAPPPPPASAPSCSVDGVEGTCIETSACAGKAGHHSTAGYCPGAADIECCTANPAPAPPATSCEVEGVEGTCIEKSACAGKAGHVSTPGFCPGAADIECCTAPPSCKVDGVEGMCVETSVCAGLSGHHSTPGYCPGAANEECCTP
jgi:hypothetical protein